MSADPDDVSLGAMEPLVSSDKVNDMGASHDSDTEWGSTSVVPNLMSEEVVLTAGPGATDGDDSDTGWGSTSVVPNSVLEERLLTLGSADNRNGAIPKLRQFNWTRDEGLTMIVYIHIGRAKVPAVIDTAAQKSIISPALRKRLNLETNGEKVILHNAQVGSEMEGSIVEQAQMKMGARTYHWDLIEADIGDEFILGFDFLQHHGCKVDAGRCVLEMQDGEKLYGSLQGNQGKFFNVSRVSLQRKTRIPAMSIKFLPVKFTNPSGVDYAIEPTVDLPVTVLQSVVKGTEPLRLCVINCTENAVTLKRNTFLGDAMEIDEVRLDTEEELDDISLGSEPDTGTPTDCARNADVQVRSVTVDASSTLEAPSEEALGYLASGDVPYQTHSTTASDAEDSPKESETDTARSGHRDRLPEHLWSLYEDTLPNLTASQAEELLEVLVSYADVFARNDLDIGCFNALEHSIRTTRPGAIKQGMRRTPLGFEQAEKATLQSMKDARVIEPSDSEWASPPVLVRKKDGSWRYCIDFRALNTVTVKDAYPLPLIDDCLDSLPGI